MPTGGIELNQQGLWAVVVAISAFFGAALKAFQITRRLDRMDARHQKMDDKIDRVAEDVAYLRGREEGKGG